MQTYSIKDGVTQSKWKQYRDQLEFGIFEFDTRSELQGIKPQVQYNL